jgi:uncharacterized protein YcbK (DUF882 family)
MSPSMSLPLIDRGRMVRALRITTAAAACVAFAMPAALSASVLGDGKPKAAPADVVVAGGLGDLLDSLAGLSHKLRARFVAPTKRELTIPVLQRLFGDSAAQQPGLYAVQDSALMRPFTFITLLPFSAKQKGRIGAYRVGNWPYERRAPRNDVYANPDGFIQVTAANQDTYVSEHFRLKDFLTHDQQDVWPKYLVLNERLVDKLELIIDDLNAHGIRVQHLGILSGFRTPEYNRQGIGEGGRARDSRHQYGDAADIYVDNDGSGRMSDLNHDHRIDWRDAKIIRDAIDRVEAAHPELVGGVGLYRGNRRHGPFVHVDARGTRARWGRA